jgi:hypothetical protein
MMQFTSNNRRRYAKLSLFFPRKLSIFNAPFEVHIKTLSNSNFIKSAALITKVSRHSFSTKYFGKEFVVFGEYIISEVIWLDF